MKQHDSLDAAFSAFDLVIDPATVTPRMAFVAGAEAVIAMVDRALTAAAPDSTRLLMLATRMTALRAACVSQD